ncbi:MAG: ABC transporter permease [Betaproteobacteria bacterium]|nr:ABC transporter permease [Betaproteobacteria bacterium]MBU6512179.1 ABC transporter permease [Betaproteobacteria bacterium]MDE1954538.1 ABC transporter permease [Betaproteobacteria bacterium]MDE2151917.1 ABC transporter permease [Betaproteobacteria bacterium]MDE2478441.1 ABC transporter permease [Betaproteobacteria bacterium]
MGTLRDKAARVWALMRKEFLALLRDRASRAVLIGPPLVQLMVFGYAATFDLNRVPYAVFDQDGGLAARQLLARFDGSGEFRRVATLHAQAQVRQALDDRRALLVLRVGPGFSRDLLSGRGARLQVLVDGRDSNTAAIVQGDVSGIVQAFNREWGDAHGWPRAGAQLRMRAWFNPNLQSRWFIVPGIVALLMLVITLLVTGLSVARERELGTFDQLLVTPMGTGEMLLGKAVPGVIIGALEGCVTVVLAVYWFHVPFTGSVAALALGMLLFLGAAVGVGLMISSMARTQQQGLLGVFLFMVPAVILSGFATPIANMPRPVQWLTLLDPVRYFLVIDRSVFLQGAGLRELSGQYAALALIGAFGMAGAAWLFRHRAR